MNKTYQMNCRTEISNRNDLLYSKGKTGNCTAKSLPLNCTTMDATPTFCFPQIIANLYNPWQNKSKPRDII